jgi:hypothetical protein
MSLGAKVATNLPYLRRYARALTGSQQTGDACAGHARSGSPMPNCAVPSAKAAALYRAFNKVWSSAFVDTVDHSGAGDLGLHETAAQERLAHITPANRQALLLVTLEDFSVPSGRDSRPFSADVEALCRKRSRKSIANRPPACSSSKTNR